MLPLMRRSGCAADASAKLLHRQRWTCKGDVNYRPFGSSRGGSDSTYARTSRRRQGTQVELPKLDKSSLGDFDVRRSEQINDIPSAQLLPVSGLGAAG